MTISRQAHGVVRNDDWTVLPELRRKFDTHLSVALGGIQRGVTPVVAHPQPRAFVPRRTRSRLVEFLEAIECGVLAHATRSEDLPVRNQIDARRQRLDCGHGHA